MRHLLLPAALIAACLTGCITVVMSDPNGTSAMPDAGAASGKTLPCDVAAVLAASCTGCHSTSSTPPMLTSYDDLTASSATHPGNTVAQDCVATMQSTTAPMPPSGLLPAADVQTLQKWIAAGYPSSTGCASTDAGTVKTADSGASPQTTQDAGTTTTKDSGTNTSAPTWTQIYNKYLASGTEGNCGPACHSSVSSASSTYTWLQGKGYISGTSSTLVKSGSSCLSWYAGNMPPSLPSDATAVTMMNAWAAAGALNN